MTTHDAPDGEIEAALSELRAEIGDLMVPDGAAWRRQLMTRVDALVAASAKAAALSQARAVPDGLAEALTWYAEQVAGCRKFGPIGDPFRQALERDGGKRAEDALKLVSPLPAREAVDLTEVERLVVEYGMACWDSPGAPVSGHRPAQYEAILAAIRQLATPDTEGRLDTKGITPVSVNAGVIDPTLATSPGPDDPSWKFWSASPNREPPPPPPADEAAKPLDPVAVRDGEAQAEKRVAEIKRRHAAIRDGALEEAARVADGFVCGGCGMDGKAGAAIRALKSPADLPADAAPADAGETGGRVS